MKEVEPVSYWDLLIIVSSRSCLKCLTTWGESSTLTVIFTYLTTTCTVSEAQTQDCRVTGGEERRERERERERERKNMNGRREEHE